MKSTGIVRNVDALGRIVIPKETRNVLDIEEGTGLEIFTDGDRIVLMKYQSLHSCIFCNEADHVSIFKGKCVCEKCRTVLSRSVNSVA